MVRDLNTLVESFPSNLVASAMGFGVRTYFQLDDSERAAPRVSFGGSADASTSGLPVPDRWSRTERLMRRPEERIVPQYHLRTVLLGLVSTLLLVSLPAGADVGWTIRNFEVQLVVNADASINVTETIDADFSVPKHGILREMPIRYAVGMHQYSLRVKLRSVDDGEGREYEISVSYEENLMKIRIGSPNFTVRGRQRYRLRYHVERAILWEGNHAWENGNSAVLRWNATGTEWQVPIDASKVTVHLPRDLNDFELNSDASTGRFGTREKAFTKRVLDSRDSRVHHRCTSTAGRDHRRGLDALGAFAKPGWWKEFSWWLTDNFPYAVFPLAAGLCFLFWFVRGRDLPGTGTIVVNYEPPEGSETGRGGHAH